MPRADLKQNSKLPRYEPRGVEEVKKLMKQATAVLVRKPSKKKKTRNTTVLSISLEPEEVALAKRQAERFGLTVSGLIRLLLRDHIATDAHLTVRPRETEGKTL